MLLVVCIAGGALFLLDYRTKSRPAVGGYTDLNTALAPERAQGFEVSIPPKRPGPYRRIPGEPAPGRSPNDGQVCRIRDASGAVVEEINLQGSEGYDQTVVYLETEDGQRTMAALKRAKVAGPGR